MHVSLLSPYSPNKFPTIWAITAIFFCFNNLFRYIWIQFIKHTTLSTVVFWLAGYYFLLLFDKPQKSSRRTGNELETNPKLLRYGYFYSSLRVRYGHFFTPVWIRHLLFLSITPFNACRLFRKPIIIYNGYLGTTLKDQHPWNLNGLMQKTETPEPQKKCYLGDWIVTKFLNI